MIDSLFAGTLLTSLLLATLWGSLALGHRLPVTLGIRWLAVMVWLGTGGLWCLLVWQGARLAPLVGMAIQMAALLAWWRQLKPARNLDWADDVAHLATGKVEGHRLIMHHIRHFDWQTREQAKRTWERREYDLRALKSVDLFVSGWGRPGIAHVLLSFGFADASGDIDDFLAFSVEVRRERHEKFSEIGGFFKQYELAIIATDERDAVRLRSNIRGEAVTLYRVLLNEADRLDLLLALVEEANSLEVTPRYYHTVTANCTTLVFAMMRRIIEELPMDHRLLLSGLLPGYVHDHGGLVPGFPLSELKRRGDITERARQAQDAPDFSRRIRKDVPGWSESS